MPPTRSFPRICIALGLPEVGALLDHARREAEAGETFLEFRLDYLPDPCRGADVIRGFLDKYPDVILLATCRRHQNRGKFNGSIEEQLAVLDRAVRSGAHAIDVEIETAEVAPERLSQFRGRAQVILSYHNYEATPPMDTIVNRMLRITSDAYKVVTTARKPSDNVRVLAAAKALPKHRMVVLAMGELGFPTRVLSPVFGGIYSYAAPLYAEGEFPVPAASLSRGKTDQKRQNFRCHRRSGAAFDFARRSQSGISSPPHGRGLSALSGHSRPSPRFFLHGRKTSAGRVQRHHPA